MKPRYGVVVCMTAIAFLLTAAVATAAEPAAAGTNPAGNAPPRLVILVRHAEKAAEPPEDPPLTAAGVARARALAAALSDAGVGAIVTSDALRTRATAEPLARELKLTPVVVSAKGRSLEEHVAAVAAEVRRHGGEVVLVVGHTDTLPGIVAALGGPRRLDVPHDEFANLFLLVPDAGDGSRLVRATYGAPDAR
jgi:broad specificity phosphatase PhoE